MVEYSRIEVIFQALGYSLHFFVLFTCKSAKDKDKKNVYNNKPIHVDGGVEEFISCGDDSRKVAHVQGG